MDAHFIDPSSVGRAQGAGDVLVLTNAQTLTRLDAAHGAKLWSWDLRADAKDEAPERFLVRAIATREHVFAVSLQKKSSAAGGVRGMLGGSSSSSGSRGYSMVVHTLAHNGTLLARREIQTTAVADGGPSDLALSAPQGVPFLFWRATDGSVKSTSLFALEPSVKGAERLTKATPIQSAFPVETSDDGLAGKADGARSSSDVEFVRVVELGAPGQERGLVAAQRSDGMGELFRLDPATGKLKMVWQSDERAHDAVWSATYDKQGAPYISRVFFSRAQHLLNFHTFWADANQLQGQVTGFSFQYDHDLNGAVVAAPFEVSPVSAYQLITRAAFVTSSGSIRLVQEDKHMWMLEEGLTQVSHSLIVDLPQGNIANADVLAATQGEGFLRRLARHAHALQRLPLYTLRLARRIAFPQPLDGAGGAAAAPGAAAAAAFSGTPGAPAPRATATNTGGAAAAKPAPVPAGAKRAPNSAKTKPKAVDPNLNPPSLAPRIAEANATASAHLVRDLFGFRKLLLQVTRRGKVYASDVGAQGRFVWEKSLVGFGLGEGEAEPRIRVLAVVQTQEAVGTAVAPIVTIIADVDMGDGKPVLTRAWDLNPITGEFALNANEGVPVALGGSKDAFVLPAIAAATHASENSLGSRKLIGLVTQANRFVVYPLAQTATALTALQGRFYHAVETINKRGPPELRGRVLLDDGGFLPTWKVRFAEGEQIFNVLPPTSDPVASQGKVLGSRSTLYKYLNPHAHLVLTKNPAQGSAAAYLVDYVSGAVLYETRIPHADLSQPLDAIYSENWIVIGHSTRNPAEGRVQRLVSAELYEDADDRREIWNWFGNFSSFARPAPVSTENGVRVYQQTYNFPRQVRKIGISTTKFGISIKALLLATEEGHLFTIPRRFLDPRRPVGRKVTQEEMEEWLIPYDPTVGDSMRWAINHVSLALQAARITTAPALLESTSLVLVEGLDTFWSRITPSNSFDLLSSSFNKLQLLLTIVGLSLGIILTKGPVRSQALKLRW